MTWVTVGSASGIAAMASETAATKSTSHASLRARPRMNITTMVRPAAATIHRVRVLSSLVSGDCSASVAESIPEIFPISDPAAVAVTIITPLPWVTGVFMKAMFNWSPGAKITPSQRRGLLLRRDALTGQGRLVDLQRRRRDDAPVGGNLVARGQKDDITDDDLFGGDLELGPTPAHPGGDLHHRLERVHRTLGLALLSQTHHRVEEGERDEQDSGVPLADRSGHDRRADEDQLHVGAVLIEEAQPPRLGLLLG